MTNPTLNLKTLDNLLTTQSIDSHFIENTTDIEFIRLLANIDRQALSQLMKEKQYKKGDIICKEGDPGHAIYLIWSGRVCILKGELTHPILLSYRGPGEVVGEMALLENDVRSATIVAIEPVRILIIGRDEFSAFIKDQPAIQHKIMATLSHRLRDADVNRQYSAEVKDDLAEQINHLQNEKEQLLALQRVRQETSDLVIHDLRNPLNLMYSAIQMLEIMLPEEAVEQNRELLDIATGGYRRMERLIESLLDVAKMESNNIELKPVLLSLPDMLRDIVLQSKIALEKRFIDVSLVIADDLPLITGDEDKIGRVIANLVDNAIKYMPNKGVLTLTAQVQQNDVRVCVADTGPGVPEKDREHIFERFAQVQGDSLKRHGFGLGLAFCRLAIEAHHGSIWAESGDNGIGSRFCFTLPINQHS